MTLQSQAPRVQTWRSSSRSNASVLLKAGMGPKIAAGAGIVVVLGLLAIVWARSGTPGAAPNAEDLAKQHAPSEPIAIGPRSASGATPSPIPAAGNTAAPVSSPSPPAPMQLSMSRQSPGTPATGGPSTAIVDPTARPNPPAVPAPTPPSGAQPQTPTPPAITDPAALPPVTAPAAPGAASGGESTRQLIAAAQQDQTAGRLIEARAKFNSALADPALSAADRGTIRSQISTINDTLVFSPTVAPNDPIAESYTIKRGDNPTNIVRNQSLPIDQRFLTRVNGLSDTKGLRIGQRIKIFRTPFHAVVHKGDHRLDLYVGSPAPIGGSPGRQVGPDGQEPDWVYIRSFRVGLGEANGTPEGQFVVKAGSKLVNPIWKHPRTGEVFAGGAPTNPIGKHWLGLEGVDDNTRRFTGYGIHGTIDPASIGQNQSMGCVRLMPDDVALIYEVLVDKVSTVKILP